MRAGDGGSMPPCVSMTMTVQRGMGTITHPLVVFFFKCVNFEGPFPHEGEFILHTCCERL